MNSGKPISGLPTSKQATTSYPPAATPSWVIVFLWPRVLSGGLFAGTCLYTTAVAHPIRLTLGPLAALANFRASLQRSERMQPPLHAVCLISTIALTASHPHLRNFAAIAAMVPILLTLRDLGGL